MDRQGSARRGVRHRGLGLRLPHRAQAVPPSRNADPLQDAAPAEAGGQSMRQAIARTARLQDPRSRQRRHGPQRRAGRSGSARATRSRRSSSARPRSRRCTRGETFYAHNLGLPELREAIAALHRAALHRPVDAERIAVTSGGVSALMLAVQALVGRGRRGGGGHAGVAQPHGAAGDPAARSVQRVSLQPEGGAWTLDLDALLAAVTPATQAADRQRAEQSDRLDADARRAAGDPRRTAAAPAPGSSPTRSTSGSTSSRRPTAARRASSTSPSPTTGWSSPTASPRAS